MRFLCSFPAEFHLGIYQCLASLVLFLIGSVRLKNMSFHIIAEFQIQYMLDLVLDLLILNRENNLYT